MRVAFIAHALEPGGAERQLLVLARGLLARGHDVLVVPLRGGGHLEAEFARAGVPVQPLARSRWWIAVLPFRLPRLLRRFRPQVVHGYLPLPNCIAVVARLFGGRPPAVMGVRGVSSEREGELRRVKVFYAFEAWCSRWAAAVIANSESARAALVGRRFPAGRVHVVPNGIDTNRFTFDAAARARLRSAWGVDDGEVLVGRVASLRPIKDYPTFLQAAAKAAAARPDVRFVCVGDGPSAARQGLEAYARELGLDGRVIWAGHHDDVPAVMSALDVAVSSSVSESSPNVIAEAMACGVPCVATDAGDSAAIVGDVGVVVPVRAADEMATAVLALVDRLAAEGDALRQAARRRVVEGYELGAMVSRTEEILSGL